MFLGSHEVIEIIYVVLAYLQEIEALIASLFIPQRPLEPFVLIYLELLL